MSIIQGTAHSGAGYNIERSLRFNSADSAYLNRTFGTPTAQKKFTLSLWVKRGALATAQMFFSAVAGGGSTNPSNCYFNSGDQLVVELATSAGGFQTVTNAVFRDTSAWYHVVLSVDLDAASGSRVRWYVNGTQQTVTYNPSEIASGAAVSMNAAVVHRLGTRDTLANYFNGYLTEVNFIDGQALTPSSFGETDPNTGVWKPKKFTGTYGTNGFYLNFSDNSGTTSTTLGKDSSGNGNNWTPNNFSVTAGAGNDSLVDTPTPYGSDTGAGGEVRGNYATLNPLMGSTLPTFANGNLQVTGSSGGNFESSYSTIGMTTGKWYAEFTWLASGSNCSQLGVGSYVYPRDNSNQNGFASGITQVNLDNGTAANRAIVENGTTLTGGDASFSFSVNDIIGIAFDADAKTVNFYKNGSILGSTYPYDVASVGAGIFYFITFTRTNSGTSSFAANFGQRPFAYTAPSGFKALCTTNLPTPTIGATSTTQANDYFNTVLYTGNGSTQSITGVGFQPDFVWLKCRATARDHRLWDAVRGTTKSLSSDLTSAEATESGLTSFDSDGFSLGSNIGSNASTETFVAWNWKANGAGSTNTSGTISSTVSANTTAGFSIVTYTGTGATGTIGHGLGVAPKMIIVKSRDQGTTGYTGNWYVYHASNTSAPETDYLLLNTTAATADDTFWNDTAPTSTVFSVGALSGTNDTSDKFVAYCFAEVAGYSAFGSYTGNGSADGPFIYCGFRPRWIMWKRTDSANDWFIEDTSRSDYNVIDKSLSPDTSSAEYSSSQIYVDSLSNGFKIRSAFDLVNGSGGTYIYAAFAEVPYKFALGR